MRLFHARLPRVCSVAHFTLHSRTFRSFLVYETLLFALRLRLPRTRCVCVVALLHYRVYVAAVRVARSFRCLFTFGRFLRSFRFTFTVTVPFALFVAFCVARCLFVSFDFVLSRSFARIVALFVYATFVVCCSLRLFNGCCLFTPLFSSLCVCHLRLRFAVWSFLYAVRLVYVEHAPLRTFYRCAGHALHVSRTIHFSRNGYAVYWRLLTAPLRSARFGLHRTAFLHTTTFSAFTHVHHVYATVHTYTRLRFGWFTRIYTCPWLLHTVTTSAHLYHHRFAHLRFAHSWTFAPLHARRKLLAGTQTSHCAFIARSPGLQLPLAAAHYFHFFGFLPVLAYATPPLHSWFILL